MALVRLDVGTMSFNTGTADGNGNRWFYQSIDGWDMPELRQTWLDRLGADGQVLGESNLSARRVIVSGIVIGTSPTGIYTAMNTMRTVMTDAVTTPISVVLYAPTGTQTLASCYTSDRTRMQVISGVAFRFQLQVTAGTPAFT